MARPDVTPQILADKRGIRSKEWTAIYHRRPVENIMPQLKIDDIKYSNVIKMSSDAMTLCLWCIKCMAS
jgi:hypothetical protein